MSESVETEKLIKEKAKQVFFQKGLLKATTQQIANEAGVNRALIHYYFRSRDQLFQAVLKEAIEETRQKIDFIFSSDDPFKIKISKYLDVFIERNTKFPYMQNFIVTEMMQDPKMLQEMITKKKKDLSRHILPALKKEIKKGAMKPVDPNHFIVNLMSLCSYPFVAKPFIQHLFSLNDKTYEKFLQDRKKVVYKLLFDEELPKRNKN